MNSEQAFFRVQKTRDKEVSDDEADDEEKRNIR